MLIVFGGSFNPPTIAHYEIAKHILNTLACEEFFFLPVGNQYPKAQLIEAVHRINMLELVCGHLEKASVCSLEVNASKVLTSFETLSLLQKQYPEQEIGFVIGADNLEDLPNWVQVEDLMCHFKLIVFRRDDIKVDEIIQTLFHAYQDRFIVLESFGKMDVSSTQYRNDLANHELVLKEVDDYVKMHHLYGRGER